MTKAIIAALTAALVLSGCQSAGGPAAPGAGGAAPSPYRVSEADFQKAQALHQKVLQSGQVYAPGENPAATQYLDRIVARIAAQRPPGSVPIRGFIIKDDDVNAFTTGTGYLYFNRGLIAALENEAQLAMVVGHEAAHVDAGHLSSGRQTDTTVSVLTELGSAALEASGVGGLAGTLGSLGVGLAGRRANAYFSQGHELEADDIGLAYTMRAGYDGLQAARAFRVLSMENGSQGRIASFFSTHPNSEGRLRILAERASATGRPAYIGAQEYAAMLSTLR